MLDRGGPKPWKVLAELVRTAIVASAFAWIAARAGDLDVGDGVVLALVAWVGFPRCVIPPGVVIQEAQLGSRTI